MHYLRPSLDRAHVILFFVNFMRLAQACHIGLGVNALHTLKVLRKHHIRADAQGVSSVKEICDRLAVTPSITHVLIEAPWVTTDVLEQFMTSFPNIHFIIRTHSEVGFLQADPGAVKKIREQILLAEGSMNLTISANSKRLTQFLQHAYNGKILYLPNLYDFERVDRKRDEPHQAGVVRISSFGALRPMKNHPSAAAAALMIARERQVNLEFYMNSNRNEGSTGIADSIRALFQGLPWAKYVEVPWAPWPEFRRTIAHMDLALQVSTTESFNITTADAIAEGVPAVVTPAIEWAPASWQASPDDLAAITRIGSAHLSGRTGADEGLRHLSRYVDDALEVWKAYLGGHPHDISFNFRTDRR